MSAGPAAAFWRCAGIASIQGSTDIPTLYNMLPSYLPQPHAFKPHKTLKEYLDSERTPTGWWHNFPKYAVSLLKAWYGDAARQATTGALSWLPKIVGDHSQLPMTLAMRDGVDPRHVLARPEPRGRRPAMPRWSSAAGRSWTGWSCAT